MPSHSVHNYVNRLLFGRSYWKINREMDKPYVFLGRYHRVLFHEPAWAYLIASKFYPGDPNAVLAAQSHFVLDSFAAGIQISRGVLRCG